MSSSENKPKSIGNFLEYLIEQSFVGTIVRDNLDLASLRGNVLNKYDTQIVSYFKSIDAGTKTYPALLLCFYMALARAIKIKNEQLDTKISEVQERNDQQNLYYYLVMFRPFFLFHIVYSKVETQHNSDYQAFFKENYGFMNDLGKDYYNLVFAISKFFQDKSELSKEQFMKHLLEVKNDKLEEFISTFVNTNWKSILTQAFRKIKERSGKDKENVLENTTNLFEKFVAKMTTNDIRATKHLDVLKEIFNNMLYTSKEQINILPYFSASESGYYTSVSDSQSSKERLHFAYFKYGRDFLGGSSNYNKHLFGVMSNLFDLIIFEALGKNVHFKNANDFTVKIRVNEMVDFLTLYTEHKSHELIQKIDDIFKAAHNTQYSTIPNGTLTSLADNGRYYYEHLMTEYLQKLIHSKRDKFRDILRDTFEQMESQRKQNIGAGIREFTKAIVNNMISELNRGFYPIDYELLQTGEYRASLTKIFDRTDKPRDYKNNYEMLIKDLGVLILDCFGERKWDSLSDR